MNRRNFLFKGSILVMAPAIVKAENIMRVKPIVHPFTAGINIDIDFHEKLIYLDRDYNVIHIYDFLKEEWK
jgi:hypothetical protein